MVRIFMAGSRTLNITMNKLRDCKPAKLNASFTTIPGSAFAGITATDMRS